MQTRLEPSTIRYAVRVARRMDVREIDIRSMVHTALESRVGLAGSTGSAGARILAVAANLEALLRLGRDREAALDHIKRRANAHLDAGVVGEFLTIVRDDALAALVGPNRTPARQEVSAA